MLVARVKICASREKILAQSGDVGPSHPVVKAITCRPQPYSAEGRASCGRDKHYSGRVADYQRVTWRKPPSKVLPDTGDPTMTIENLEEAN